MAASGPVLSRLGINLGRLGANSRQFGANTSQSNSIYKHIVYWGPSPQIIPQTKGGTTEGGFLLALYRITFVDQDLPSPPRYLGT